MLPVHAVRLGQSPIARAVQVTASRQFTPHQTPPQVSPLSPGQGPGNTQLGLLSLLRDLGGAFDDIDGAFDVLGGAFDVVLVVAADDGGDVLSPGQ